MKGNAEDTIFIILMFFSLMVGLSSGIIQVTVHSQDVDAIKAGYEAQIEKLNTQLSECKKPLIDLSSIGFALVLIALVAVFYFGIMKPDNERRMLELKKVRK